MRGFPAAMAAALMIVLGLSGCASLRPGFETPTVTVTSFDSIPSPGSLPEFAIGLRVLNPNPGSLSLRGVAYTVSIEGHDLVKGVANDLPVIEGYGSGEFTVTASPSLFGGARLLTDLLSRPRDGFIYRFEARLDAGILSPDIRIVDEGKVDLR